MRHLLLPLLVPLLCILSALAADAPLGAPQRRAPPAGWVDLQALIPTLQVHIGYATADNFTGTILPGYGVPGAWLRREAGLALQKVQDDLAPQGLGLLVYDAYRPQRASQAMVAWGKRTQQMELFQQGYIASKSGHNHGHTIDLTLVTLSTGQPLDMGTPWDTLTPAANTSNATGAALQNRMKLKGAMSKRGWINYPKEWWHFRFPMEGTTPRDVPYACFEPDEGAWVAPEGWRTPGWVPPPPPSQVPTCG